MGKYYFLKNAWQQNKTCKKKDIPTHCYLIETSKLMKNNYIQCSSNVAMGCKISNFSIIGWGINACKQ